MSQLTRLIAALKSRPDDPFIRYAIAMEHLKHGDFNIALEKFAQLLESHPRYIATYLQYGLALAAQEQIELARKILEAGIRIAEQCGEHHAAAEMSEVINQLE